MNIIRRFHANKSFYFIGAKQQIIDETVSKLKNEYKDMVVAGYHNGYINQDEGKQIIDDIKYKKPDVVFVAMGSPKQELFMSEIQKHHPDAIYQGLGGSFDVYTGHVDRAPKWWIDHNLEFAYRFLTHPKRWKRLLPIFKMAFLLLIKKI